MPSVQAVGRYVLVDCLTKSGGSEVWIAKEPENERPYALKVLRPTESPAEDSRRFRRLQRESDSLAKNPHLNIVRIHECGFQNGRTFLAMELETTQTLTMWLGEKPRSWKEILEKFLQAGRGLAAAHAVGVVHRDFKPDNVLMGHDGQAKVTDFGMPSLPSSDSVPDAPSIVLSEKELELRASRTRNEPLFPYLAPELGSGIPPGPAADQFSFCYALEKALENIAVGDPATRRSLDRVLRRGMAKAPSARFTRMELLLSALGRTMAGPLYKKHPRLALGAAIAAGVLLLATVVLIVRALTRDTPIEASACAGGVGISDLWPKQRERLRDALKNSGTNQTSSFEAAETFVGTVDAYSRRWESLQVARCEVQQDKAKLGALGTNPALFLRRWDACLQWRRHELSSLLEVASEPDGRSAQMLAQVARELPAPEVCRDPKVLATFPALPTESIKLSQGNEVRRVLTLGRTWASVGQTSRAVKTLDAAATQAETLGDKAVVAEARYVQAALARGMGDATRAESLFFGSLEAAEASRHDEVAAQSALDLSQILSTSRPAESERWLRLAAALGERLSTGESWRARIELQKAELAFAKGDLPAAIVEAEKATARVPENTQEGWQGRTLLATAYAKQGKTVLSCQRATEALGVAQALFGADHLRTAQNLEQRGECALLDGKLQDAYTLLGSALKAKTKALGAFHESLAETLTSLGELQSLLGKHGDAQTSLRQALVIHERTEKLQTPEHFRAWSLYGMALVNSGRRDQAHGQLQKAVYAIEKAHGYKSPLLATPLAALGKLYLSLGWYSKATAVLQRSLSIPDPSRPPYEKADVKFALARSLWSLNDKLRSVRLGTESADLYRESGEGWQKHLEKVEGWLEKRQSTVARR